LRASTVVSVSRWRPVSSRDLGVDLAQAGVGHAARDQLAGIGATQLLAAEVDVADAGQRA
jgi:hypothetical protein